MPSVEVTGKNGFFNRYPYRVFEVSPSSGELVKPIDLKFNFGSFNGIKIPLPCIQVYHHQYNLDYDLLVKITDKSKGSLNYFFQFPVRIVINNNMPKHIARPLKLGESLTVNNEKFSSNESKKYPLYVWAIDKSTGEFLEGVNISYKCISLETFIGKTSRLSYDGIKYGHNPFLKGLFPYCYNGEIIAEKEGYNKAIVKNIITDSSLLKNDTKANIVEVDLIPKLTFNIDVSSFLIVYKEDGKSARIRNSSDGMIFVNIENKNLNFENQILWPIEEKGFFDKFELLDDSNAVYNVSVMYIDSNNNLKGLIEYNNWKPDLNKIKSGAKVQFIIPATRNKINEKNYKEFIDYVHFVLTDPHYGIVFEN